MPGIVNDLEGYYADITGEDPGEVGDRVEEFVENLIEAAAPLIGPITAIGLDVEGLWRRSC